MGAEATKKSQSLATTKYIKNHQRRFTISFHNDNDAEIIAWLEGKENVKRYIAELVEKDMKENEK